MTLLVKVDGMGEDVRALYVNKGQDRRGRALYSLRKQWLQKRK